MYALDSNNLLQERMMDMEEPQYKVCFHCGKVNHWARNCTLFQLLTEFSPKWTGSAQKVTAKLCQNMVG